MIVVIDFVDFEVGGFFHLNISEIIVNSLYILSKELTKKKYTFLRTRVNIMEQILCAPLNFPIVLFTLKRNLMFTCIMTPKASKLKRVYIYI